MDRNMKLTGVAEEYGIYGLLFSLSNRIQTIGDRDFKDLTMKQHFLMVALGMVEEPLTLREMGELIGCSYQNVKRMALQLEKNGYLTIEKDEMDRRKQRLVSTGKIERMADAQREKTKAFMEHLYLDIDRKDLEVTLATLMKMDQNLGGTIR